ncbi:MAG TPA: DUF1549 domain-containing protein [Verrucomicrobiae bacterium]|nr:DUF1549 domain-containing protein [Verrucomicrobiae bacterium]
MNKQPILARVAWQSLLVAGALIGARVTVLADSPENNPPPATLRIHYSAKTDQTNAWSLHLRGADARQQLLVTAEAGAGPRDFTREVEYTTSPAGIVQVSAAGVVTPLSDGETTLTAKSKDGLTAQIPVKVEDARGVLPVNFPNQIVPIFTKAGCNGGGCHGKASGQNGFRLSLLGFEPAEDYEHLVKEARGRRLFPAAPDHSLLLLKASGSLPHGGGKRLEAGSTDYQLLVRWIKQGMPYGQTNAPTIARIEVFPSERVMPLQGEQQLTVTAYYSDGSSEDVTSSALYEPNDKDMAKVDEGGHVTFFKQPGNVAVMVRYQAQVAVFQAIVPLGAPVDHLPAPRNFIDQQVFAKLKAMGMPPSGPCDDATFLRRVTVDIAGRLPTPEETNGFLADTNPAKRERWIDTLLASPGYADYFANKWSALLRNKRTAPNDARGNYAFHAWLRESLRENRPYSEIVRDVLTASGDLEDNPPVAWFKQVREVNAELEDTAQLFLGMRLQCAQCHHHPFEKWSQHDYYSFAAFFSRVSRKRGSQPGEEIVYHRRGTAEATNKKTRAQEKPAGLGGPQLNLSPDDDPRYALVEWMTNTNNPYFAKSLVNRYWKHFFNRGIVDPEDDLRATNPPTNPELLDALAKHFTATGYDLKDLIRVICQSRVYQLSAIPNQYNAIDKQNFSRYYPKRLTAEVLFDAINQVTKAESKFDGQPAGTHAVALPDNSFNANSYFLTVFGRPESSSSCECERSQDASLAQSLHLLNAKDIQEKLAADTGRAALLAKDANRGDDDKVRELYRWVYTRAPEPAELQFARDYVGRKTSNAKDTEGRDEARRVAYEDMVWALINTKEFLFNH